MTAETMRIVSRSVHPVLYDSDTLRTWQPGDAHLIMLAGQPWGLSYRCPCGDRLSPTMPSLIKFGDSGGPHTLIAADPLEVSPSIGAAFPCKPGGSQRCHFFVRSGRVEWCAPL